MKIKLTLLYIFCLPFFVAAQKLNSAEEQIFKAEAVKMVEQYYLSLSKLRDSVKVHADTISYRQDFIERFFENNDIYVYNDLSPDDNPSSTSQRVLTIDEYLTALANTYPVGNTKLQLSLKSSQVEQVSYNSQAPIKFYYAKIRIERNLKGMYMGKYFTDNTKTLDFYVKTHDKPDTRLKEYKIIGIDFESKQIKIENLPPDEGIAKGMRFFDSEDYETAFKYLMKYANERKLKKNSNATFALGYMYFWGRGTERSDEEMLKWLELAADKDNIYALHYLGENYYYGEYGVEENEKKAFKYIEKAARKGFHESHYFLGERYEKGDSKEAKKNRNHAVREYKKAAKQGHVKAKEALKRLGEKF